jgi:hypothetical protein
LGELFSALGSLLGFASRSVGGLVDSAGEPRFRVGGELVEKKVETEPELEDNLREAHTKVPDALLVDESGKQIKRVLEYGGQYSAQRLENFHRYWSTRAPYEIW